jgi:hypothetical protein
MRNRMRRKRVLLSSEGIIGPQLCDLEFRMRLTRIVASKMGLKILEQGSRQ